MPGSSPRAGSRRSGFPTAGCGPGAPGALANLEFDLGALAERLEAGAGYVGVMDEDVLRPILGRDEAVALGIVEPLHGSACHNQIPPYLDRERVRKALWREPHSF